MSTDRLAAIRERLAAQRAAAPTAGSTLKAAATATKAIVSAAPESAVPSATESNILRVSEAMTTLQKFDPQNFVNKLVLVRNGVESKAPGVATYLQEINRNLNQYPELVHILNDEQIGVIVSGLLFMTNTNMVQASAAGKRKAPLTDTELQLMF